ncbi:hypothetical protein [Siccirubricoccus phaeus]|uniref:hypothetical protein n=1 Tax=Siccirubricoccus phaeus TaxID=2595053 RepID=UPI0011F1247D|nr:hypothetical protein [Siccirubricoccus phaeus]
MSLSGVGAPSTPTGLPSAAGSAVRRSPQEEFLEFARMTPAERMRAAMLAEMGLTEEELKNMPPEKRAAINAEIAQRVRDQVLASRERQPGALLDLSA